jgi:hypothetical protein
MSNLWKWAICARSTIARWTIGRFFRADVIEAEIGHASWPRTEMAGEPA